MAEMLPIVLGIFEHPEAGRCECVAPGCLRRPFGFATVLFRGLHALPVCDVHSTDVAAQDRTFGAPPCEECRDPDAERHLGRQLCHRCFGRIRKQRRRQHELRP